MPSDALARLEALVRERQPLAGILLLRSRDATMSLGDADAAVQLLRRDLGVSHYAPVPSEDALAAMVESLPGTTVALEAVWDGSTFGWFVRLVAIYRGDDAVLAERGLAVFSSEEGDARLFQGTTPPWPESVRATEMGEALARRLGVPFFFASPGEPDDCAPRWWDGKP